MSKKNACKRDVALKIAKILKVNAKNEGMMMVDAFCEAIRQITIDEGSSLSINGFGSFKVIERSNISTDGKFKKITREVAFQPSEQLTHEEITEV